MCVWREVDRQVVFKEATMVEDPGQEALSKLLCEPLAHHVEDPDPRQRAEGDLKRAGPIDPALIRVLLHPRFDLLHQFVEVLL